MNKKEDSEADKRTKPLTDLQLSVEQAEQTKAGALASGGGGVKVIMHDISINK